MSKLGAKRKKERIHAYVATPAYDGKVDVGYSQSMTEAAFCCPLHQIYVTASYMGNGAFIELARNVFVKYFLEKEECKDATHLFFVDSDLKFEARAFVGLLKANLPICAGAYRRRQEPEEYPVKWTPHPELGGLWVEDGWIMCDRVATGFLCISRQVIEEMAAEAKKVHVTDEGTVPWLFETKLTEDGRFMGEDFVFCDKYREKYGKPIPVWPNFDFVHAGYKCNFEDFLSRQIEAQEKAQVANG